MKAVVINKSGGPEVLEYKTDQPVPPLSAGQVLVKNHFSGINYIDTYFRTGLYPAPAGFPMILGQEGAGVVAALPEGGKNPHGFQVGDRVVWLKSGGYAEYTAVPEDKVVKIPDGITDEDAVGGFLMGITALTLMRESYAVRRGDWVLVHAAAGGVGLLMCQLLRAAGAHTIGTAGGPEKCELARQNGAEYMIDYKAPDFQAGRWVDKVREITGGEGVHVVYDSVGKDTWEGSLDAIRRLGSVIYFGASSGSIPPFNIMKLAQKNARVMRPTMMNYTVTRDELVHWSDELFKLLRAGDLKIRLHNAYPLQDAQQAHRDLEGRKTTGKSLLKM